jgi:hypothetical protein
MVSGYDDGPDLQSPIEFCLEVDIVNVIICAFVVSKAMKVSIGTPFDFYTPLGKTNPLRRGGDPEMDIGRCAVFLASTDSDYITACVLNVDGGAGDLLPLDLGNAGLFSSQGCGPRSIYQLLDLLDYGTRPGGRGWHRLHRRPFCTHQIVRTR